ncbi:MAG: replicative DNA helicase [Bacilli bacterium]|nr:replicative DNA helicase [Bacilli bacterium]
MANRTMPNNLDAEMNILGIAFLNDYAVNKICEELTFDIFYDEKHQKIFNAINELHKNHIPIDITTITEELNKKKSLSSVGGIEYISEIIDSVVSSANLDYYIQIIKDNALRRNLINTATNIVTNAYEEESTEALIDNAERNILNVVKTKQTSEFLPISVVLKTAQEHLEELSKNNKKVTGLETGFYDLDKVTAGLHGGEMIILAARPGMGKTAFALNIATNAAQKTDKAVAIFNLEMSAEMLVNRMLSSVGQIDSYKLQTGQMQNNDWKKYNEAVSQLSDTNIYIEDNAGITSSEIRAKCRRLANSEKGLGLVVIDYLQLVTTGNKRVESRQVEVSEISRSLKTMALELDVPVIALAQLSRSAEKRENSQPMLADLRESGSLEQDADMVLFINRKDYYEAKSEKKESIVPVDLIIAKHRKGSTGVINLLFELKMSNFRNFMQTELEEPPVAG